MEHVDHILIVDDDREIRELLSSYLKKNGLRASIAADGRQMRAFLEANTVDLIVLDVMMPGDDGLVLCRELRAGRHKATPILMLTARNDEMDRVLGLEMGADDYLANPSPHASCSPASRPCSGARACCRPISRSARRAGS
jgi:DNA-binding response OmpR family regulator